MTTAVENVLAIATILTGDYPTSKKWCFAKTDGSDQFSLLYRGLKSFDVLLAIVTK